MIVLLGVLTAARTGDPRACGHRLAAGPIGVTGAPDVGDRVRIGGPRVRVESSMLRVARSGTQPPAARRGAATGCDGPEA